MSKPKSHNADDTAINGRSKKIASAPHVDGRSQSERFIAKARELGLDEREETFDVALTKVARRKSVWS